MITIAVEIIYTLLSEDRDGTNNNIHHFLRDVLNEKCFYYSSLLVDYSAV